MIEIAVRTAHAGRRVAAVLVQASVLLAAVGCSAVSHAADARTTVAGECSPGRPLPAGTTRRQFSFGGATRSYLLHVPPGYNGVRRLPVVVTFHGLGTDAAEQMAASDFAAVANRDDFVVVAPESRGPGWDLTTPPSQRGSDAAFVVALMHGLPSVACVDADRMFATGFSNGAAEVFALACANIGGFAAYGAVAGTFYVPACHRAPPQAIVYFHGTADPLVPINGEVVSGTTIAPARQAMADWAAHDGCSAGPHQSAVAPDVSLVAWSGCRDDAEVDYYIIAGGGHSWPGAPLAVVRTPGLFYGHTTENISASQIMWDFFARRSR